MGFPKLACFHLDNKLLSLIKQIFYVCQENKFRNSRMSIKKEGSIETGEKEKIYLWKTEF